MATNQTRNLNNFFMLGGGALNIIQNGVLIPKYRVLTSWFLTIKGLLVINSFLTESQLKACFRVMHANPLFSIQLNPANIKKGSNMQFEPRIHRD